MEEFKQFLENFLNISGIEGYDLDVKNQEEIRVIKVNIRVSDGSFLIGKFGQTLDALEHIWRSVLNKKMGLEWKLHLDVNGYREAQNAIVLETARRMSRQVMITGKEASLEPMNSRQRLAVHTELSLNADVYTESMGEGLERHIVIKPIDKGI